MKQSEINSLSNGRYNRREFVVFGGAAAVGFVALTGCGETSSSDKAEELPIAYPVSSEQAEATINGLVQSPDLYKDREYADPNILFGMSPEELEYISEIRITEANRTNEGFAEDLRQILNLYFVAGHELSSVKDARSKGHAVGERDSAGNTLGKYGDYVVKTLGQHMEPGVFQRYYNGVDTIEAIETLRGYQRRSANRYEDEMSTSITSTRAEATADGTIYTNLESVEERPLEVPGFDRRLAIDMSLRRPNRKSSDWNEMLSVNCYIKDGQGGKYDIVLQGANIVKIGKAKP